MSLRQDVKDLKEAVGLEVKKGFNFFDNEEFRSVRSSELMKVMDSVSKLEDKLRTTILNIEEYLGIELKHLTENGATTFKGYKKINKKDLKKRKFLKQSESDLFF